MTEQLSYIDVNPQGEVKSLVVWMHGLGDSGHGFAPLVPELNLPDNLGIRFVFPHAPVRPITINNGLPMRGWYDIVSFDMNNRADEKGVLTSAEQLQALIDSELAKHNLTHDKLVIAGFSQGGVMAYHLGCRQPEAPAGILSLSAYLSMPTKLAAEATEAAKTAPVLAMHGVNDEIIPVALGKQSAEVIKQAGFEVTWQDYPMQHNVCAEQIGEISKWLQAVLTSKSPA
ncbi:carboxylesterase [Catenovulum agarivorans DS-2]|uniref:Carboxylesterase n=1 Tax=Catenovulum agarivorans DS-2 TaxID=1328313 RepID=W7QU14_9ALTE|nr:dienelactone hydrolase family protein [Catenovulum agarivorans]EWH08935.1 carboxylesterase [Catenovulum agarivorans DS-2]